MRVSAEESSLIDPLMLEPRRFDRLSPFEIRFDFRHDVLDTDWAYGFHFRDAESAYGYRVSEVSLSYNAATYGSIFVGNKDVLGLTVRAQVGNIFDGKNVLERSVYSGPRDRSPILFTESQRLSTGQTVSLSVSGSF